MDVEFDQTDNLSNSNKIESSNASKNMLNRNIVNNKNHPKGIQMFLKKGFITDLKSLLNLDDYCLKMINQETITEISNEDSSLSLKSRTEEEIIIPAEDLINEEETNKGKSKGIVY